jgi:hypothetical protein
MVLASPELGATTALFEAYLTALESLKLPFHKPVEVSAYSKAFFGCKSKAPYALGSPKHSGISPWVAFLGYHIRYDGRLRVRKDSISKEIDKQIAVYHHVLSSVDRKGTPIRVSGAQALHRARMRLFAMSVGRSGIHNHGPEIDHEMCWTTGFELLKKYPHVRSQLKILDRTRASLLARLSSKLVDIKKRSQGLPDDNREFLRYYGRPFSYFAQFNRPSGSSSESAGLNKNSLLAHEEPTAKHP